LFSQGSPPTALIFILKTKIMLHKLEYKVTTDFYNQPHVTDEVIFRDLARKMVSDIPLEDLKKIIKFKKLDPNKPEEWSMDYKTDDYQIDQLIWLERNKLILFTAEIFFKI